MRYYEIAIEGGGTYSSHPGGAYDPNALQVELDISVVGAATPDKNAFVRVWGVGLQAISQARDLFQKKITVKGGMKAGLPLAKPGQSGVLASGWITKCFGNWQGVDQSLDVVFNASVDGVSGGANPTGANNHVVLKCPKGQKLDAALAQALKQAFPDLKVINKVTKNLAVPQAQHGFYRNLEEIAQYAARFSQQIVGGKYQGLSIVYKAGTISLVDGGDTGQKQVSFTDLIGQPTWIEPNKIQFKTVMRADLDINDKVTLPRTFINSTGGGAATAGTSANQQMTFSGQVQIVSMRHVGHSRQPSGDAWVSVFEATAGT